MRTPLYQSIDLNKRAEKSIAHGSLTNSKRPSTFVRGVYPTHAERGFGSTLICSDGRDYIDFIGGLGTNLFGYGNPDIARAVTNVMQTGTVFSLSSSHEVEYAEKIKGVFPFLEKVRFLKTGSEGCSAAVRIARAYTGKTNILTEGYHGWHDEFISLTEPANGVKHQPYIDGIKDNDMVWPAAAVIIEPIITDISTERIEWLAKLREDCTKHGTILIYDETITAFRFPEYSAAKYYNILPDLWIGGKALGGGLPLSVVGGRSDIMEADYFVSSTFAGDRTAIAAGSTAIDLMYNDFKPSDLWIFGTEFMERFNAISENVQLEGYPTRGVFEYKDAYYRAMFMQEMLRASILIGPSWFYNKFLHKEIDNVLSCVDAICKKIESGYVFLEGVPPQSPFAMRFRKKC